MTSHSRNSNGDTSALGRMAQEAEAQRVAKNQVREEARQIRSREMERIRQEEDEAEEGTGRQNSRSSASSPKPPTTPGGRSVGRQGSVDSTASSGGGTATGTSAAQQERERRAQVTQLEERYKEAMMVNAQLDNEKQILRYEVDLLKDKLEDLQDTYSTLHRNFIEKKQEHSYQRMQITELDHRLNFTRQLLEARDQLIAERGFVLLSTDSPENNHVSSAASNGPAPPPPVDTRTTTEANSRPSMALVSKETADLLGTLPDGDFESRLRILFSDRDNLRAQVERLEGQVEEEKQRADVAQRYDARLNGLDPEDLRQNIQSTRAQAQDYKFKLQQSMQKTTALEGDVIRLEGQVKRYKSIADSCEKQEEELKQEKRKFQRELREASSRIEDLKSENATLNRKLEKLNKPARGHRDSSASRN